MRVRLNGTVIPSGSQWLYDYFGIDAFSPALVRQAVENNPEGEDLELEINSPGGSSHRISQCREPILQTDF